MNRTRNRRRTVLAATAIAAAGVLGACSGGSTNPTGATANAAPQTPATGLVLPVSSNPITNNATADGLSIKSVLVENNVNPATGKDAPDHLEIALTNSGSVELGGVEVFYTFQDPKTGASDSYYLKLPDTFTIPAGGTRIAHFDNSGAPDHFPVNKFSLYHTDTNPLTVTVTVSATGAKVQTATINKDAGGAETAD